MNSGEDVLDAWQIRRMKEAYEWGLPGPGARTRWAAWGFGPNRLQAMAKQERADKASGRLPTPIGPGSLGITVKHESRHAGHDPVGLSHAMRIRRASQTWDWDACLNPDLDYGYGSMARADC